MQQIKNIVKGPYEPQDNTVIWIDTSNPDAPIQKAHVNGAWRPVGESLDELMDNYNEPSNAGKIPQVGQDGKIEWVEPSGDGVSTLVVTGEFDGEAFVPDNNTPEFFDQALNGMKDGTHIVLLSYREEGAEPGEEYQTEIAMVASHASDLRCIYTLNTLWTRPSDSENE